MYHELARLSPVLHEMGSENAHGCAQTRRMAPALTFSEPYDKDDNEFLSNAVQVTGDEIWISFVNAETKEQ
jgi:hypothetical protein